MQASNGESNGTAHAKLNASRGCRLVLYWAAVKE